MVKTPEEAAKLWCPHVRTGLTAGMAVNNHIGHRYGGPQAGDVHEETRCVSTRVHAVALVGQPVKDKPARLLWARRRPGV